MQPGVSVAAVARQHGVNANLLFGWCRLHRRGLLDPGGDATPALLPVKITEPTLTPSRRSTRTPKVPRRTAAKSSAASSSAIEVFVGDQLRVRLEGEAQREVLERLLAWLPAR
jgi:transposase